MAGDLILDWDTLTCATSPEQQVIVWTAEPGSASEQSLAFLASWAADHLPDGDGLPDGRLAATATEPV